TTYSCILEHVDTDIWKLRGIVTNLAAIEAIRKANHLKPREKRLLQYGWNDSGKLWIATKIPHLNKNSMVIGIPGTIQRYLAGREFECKSKNGKIPCGIVAINEKGTSYGYGRFIRRFGLDENDIIISEFDLSENTATLSMSNEDIIDDSI
ncbi:MAG: hypothetical protein ACREHG_06625, partial [Candidatus Saccharimonadales bacterium]